MRVILGVIHRKIWSLYQKKVEILQKRQFEFEKVRVKGKKADNTVQNKCAAAAPRKMTPASSLQMQNCLEEAQNL